jgi:methylated-DNA-[protein]-cysteine S-methyltransferase
MPTVAYDKISVRGLGDVWFAIGARGLWRVDIGATEMGFVEQLFRSGAAVRNDRTLTSPARRKMKEYFDGRRRAFDLKIDWSRLEGFTRKALQVAARIPHGQTMSYGEVAARAGSPRAARAAGNAMGKNPFPIIVPCHRVINSDGSIGGFGGHLEHKRFLLRREGIDPALMPGGGQSESTRSRRKLSTG